MIKKNPGEEGSRVTPIAIKFKTRTGRYEFDWSGEAKLYTHPKWRPSSGSSVFQQYDVALIAFDSWAVTPTWLKRKAHRRTLYAGGIRNYEVFWGYGWGASDPQADSSGKLVGVGALRKALVTTQGYVGRTFLTWSTAKVCKGDSGGPAFRVTEAGSSVAGVASSFDVSPEDQSKEKVYCASRNEVSTWSRVGSSMDFIERVMQKKFGQSFSCNNTGNMTFQCW